MSLPFVTAGQAEKISREVSQEEISKVGGVTQAELEAAIRNAKGEPIIVPDDETDFSKYIGKMFRYVGAVYYPCYSDSEDCYWFNFDEAGNFNVYYLSESSLEHYYGGQINLVIPNPTLAGTEGALTGLQVGNDKFKNTILYKHEITIWDDNTEANFYIINNSPQAITLNNLVDLRVGKDCLIVSMELGFDHWEFLPMRMQYFVSQKELMAVQDLNNDVTITFDDTPEIDDVITIL